MVLHPESKPASVTAMPWAHLRLPPFPQVAVRVMQLATNENVQLHQLCDLISADPAFASEVLTIANSLLYSPRFPACSVMQAVSVLGATHLQGVCVTVGVRSYLGKTLRLPAMRTLWRHNLATAVTAQRLASHGIIDREVAFTAGILHDIGRFALSVVQPQEYAILLDRHHGLSRSILQGERDLFGWDHCEAGAQLVADWNLPAELESAISIHHEPRRKDGSWNLAELVKVSCRMADTAGFPAFSGNSVSHYQDLLDELPARERRLFYPVIESLASELQNAIQAVESA
jgi:putative nucleotidyltransferase with HDIG domain